MSIIIEETQFICTEIGSNLNESGVHIAENDSNDTQSRIGDVPSASPTVPATYGDYVRYKGRVWMTRQDATQDVQGANIAVFDEHSGHFSVLGYINRKKNGWTHTHDKYFPLETIVWSVLTSFGWHEEHCRWLLK